MSPRTDDEGGAVMTGTLKFKVQTDDDQGRLVQHRVVRAGSPDAAARIALCRRYRLPVAATPIDLQAAAGSALWPVGYMRGDYRVWKAREFIRPLHSGWFMVEEVA